MVGVAVKTDTVHTSGKKWTKGRVSNTYDCTKNMRSKK